MIVPKKKKEEFVKMPDGTLVTRRAIKDGIVEGVAKAFREARKGLQGKGDWIKEASERVSDHLIEVDAYFDQMLKSQKMIEKGTRKNVKRKFFSKKSKG